MIPPEHTAEGGKAATAGIAQLLSAKTGVALLLVGSCWMAVRVLLTAEPGLFEARFLALQFVAVLALLVPLTASAELGSNRRMASWFLRLVPAPFVALVLLPAGLRGFSTVLLVVVAAIALATCWGRKEHGFTFDIALVAAMVAVSFLFYPIVLITGGDLARLSLLAAALVIGTGVAGLRRIWGDAGLAATASVLLLAGISWFSAVALVVAVLTEWALRMRADTLATRIRWAAVAIAVAVGCLASLVTLLIPMLFWARRRRRGWFAALVVLGGLLAMALPSRPWSTVAEGVLLAALVFPLPIVVMLRGEGLASLLRLQLHSEGLWRLLTGIALAGVALRTLDPSFALVPTALLWCSPREPLWSRGDAAPAVHSSSAKEASIELPPLLSPMAAAWLGFWWAAVAVAAQYPWLRPVPLQAQIEWARRIAGDTALSSWQLAGMAMVVLLLAVFLRSASPRRSALAPLLLAIALLPTVAFGLYQIAPNSLRPGTLETLSVWPPKVLTREQPSVEIPLRRSQAAWFATGDSVAETARAEDPSVTLWMDSFLANANTLKVQRSVARVELVMGAGASAAGYTGQMLNGTHTAEWRTPAPTDPSTTVDATGDTTTAVPFSKWWSDGDPSYLGRRYRARVSLRSQPPLLEQPEFGASESQASATELADPIVGRLTIELDDSLPEAVQLRIDRIALAVHD